MAPPKPKKMTKVIEKPIEKPIMKKKNKKRNYHSFSIYLYKLLQIVSNEKVGITRQSMMIMNNFVYDMMEKLAVEAGRLVAHGKKTTISSHDVQSAVKLLIPGELAKHANIEGLKAVTSYYNSKDKETK